MPEAWTPYPYKGPSAQDLLRGAPPNPGGLGPPADMQYWLSLGFANKGKQTEGEYQKNISEASTLPGIRAAEGGAYDAAAKLNTERAATEAARRFLDPEAWGVFYNNLPDEYRAQFQRYFPQPGAAPGSGAPSPVQSVQPPLTSIAPIAPSSVAPSSVAPPSAALPSVPSIYGAPRRYDRSPLPRSPLSELQAPLPSLLRPMPTMASNSLLNLDATTSLRKGTADVKAPAGKGLEALLPMLMAARPAGPPARAAPTQGLKKGSANVKSKGSKSKSDKGSEPAGLEALLPMLMAASRGGGGAVGPQAADALPPPMAPGAAAPPGFARGVSSVMGYADGGEVLDRYVPPPYVLSPNQSGRGEAYVPPSYMPPRGFAYGVPSVPSADDVGTDAGPNYPVGAGYLFGAAAVPGAGSGKTDTVPAMLAPHEAVLNRAAADMLGRGLIAALNQHGAAQMGMRRGAAT